MSRSGVRLASCLVVAVIATTGCAGHVNDTVWQPFAEWSHSSWVGQAIANSSWLFAVIESFHLVGLALLGGAVLLVDFSLLGFALSDERLPQLSKGAEPWLLIGLAIALVSGVLLFLSEATKFYSPGFWDSAEAPFIYKMLFLILAVLFTISIRRSVVNHPDSASGPSVRRRVVGATSLILWLGVGVGGRLIGFY